MGMENVGFLRDESFVTIIGNLIVKPVVRKDDKYGQVAYSRIASNPFGRKYDAQGEKIPEEKRNRMRNIFGIKVTDQRLIDSFANETDKRTRVFIEGIMGTRRVPLSVPHPEKRGKFIDLSEIEIIDDDGEKVILDNLKKEEPVIYLSRFLVVKNAAHEEEIIQEEMKETETMDEESGLSISDIAEKALEAAEAS